MRRRGDRVIIVSGEYAGHQGRIESNVFQRPVDYPDEWSNGHQVMLDLGKVVIVRWDQVGTTDNRHRSASAEDGCPDD